MGLSAEYDGEIFMTMSQWKSNFNTTLWRFRSNIFINISSMLERFKHFIGADDAAKIQDAIFKYLKKLPITQV